MIPEGKTPAERAEIKAWLKGRSKFMTGFCNEYGKPGEHEGQKPRSFRGTPMKTCPMWDTCPCECHMLVDKMFAIANMDRMEVPNPEYVSGISDFVMPTYDSPVAVDDALAVDGVLKPPDAQRHATAPPVPAAAPLAERRTETGRAGRGTLEAQVWEACLALAELDPLTPKLVGEWIARKYTIPTPSSGAINAVWDRWEKLEFARQAKKPNRFLGFTGDSSWDRLQRIKVSLKVQERSAASAAKRGIRR